MDFRTKYFLKIKEIVCVIVSLKIGKVVEERNVNTPNDIIYKIQMEKEESMKK